MLAQLVEQRTFKKANTLSHTLTAAVFAVSLRPISRTPWLAADVARKIFARVRYESTVFQFQLSMPPRHCRNPLEIIAALQQVWGQGGTVAVRVTPASTGKTTQTKKVGQGATRRARDGGSHGGTPIASLGDTMRDGGPRVPPTLVTVTSTSATTPMSNSALPFELPC